MQEHALEQEGQLNLIKTKQKKSTISAYASGHELMIQLVLRKDCQHHYAAP